MCYSAEVSFGTWAFGMISAFYLYSRGASVQSFAFPLMVTQMQLVEGLRWIRAVDERVLAILAKLVLWFQPAAGLYEARETSLILPYAIAQGLAEFFLGSRDLRFVVAGDGHFQWKWLDTDSLLLTAPYWIALTYAAYRVLPWTLLVALFLIYVYYRVRHGPYKTEGSLWCVAVNVMWIYYLMQS